MEQAGIKGFIKSILDSNALSRSLIMNPIRNYSLHKHYLSLLSLNELDKETKNLWLERIRKVNVSSDDAKINSISNSGKLKDGKLTMHNGIVIDPLSYYGAPVVRMLMENNEIHEPQEEYVFQEALKSIPENATMLETASEMITKRAITRFIFISTHSQDLHYNCIDFLNQNGYIILCDTDMEESFSEDGLILVRDPAYKGLDSYTISSRKKEDLAA